MIVSVFVRRLKPGATFEDFVREWVAPSTGIDLATATATAPQEELKRLGFVK